MFWSRHFLFGSLAMYTEGVHLYVTFLKRMFHKTQYNRYIPPYMVSSCQPRSGFRHPPVQDPIPRRSGQRSLAFQARNEHLLKKRKNTIKITKKIKTLQVNYVSTPSIRLIFISRWRYIVGLVTKGIIYIRIQRNSCVNCN